LCSFCSKNSTVSLGSGLSMHDLQRFYGCSDVLTIWKHWIVQTGHHEINLTSEPNTLVALWFYKVVGNNFTVLNWCIKIPWGECYRVNFLSFVSKQASSHLCQCQVFRFRWVVVHVVCHVDKIHEHIQHYRSRRHQKLYQSRNPR
jgi:hypothetical protein